jgi:DNA repair protein SbcC/Rad50
MILKRIILQNFRSYGGQSTTIELGRGISLFEGDIGSGKSTILYAVEFALFGLGELEAKHILRANADSGKVALDFEVNGQEYTVVRAIDRKRGVKASTIQTRGWIREPGESLKELSPTELRSRVLQILNFREKQNIRASSRIFRYAIFTPQELMKEVLAQRPEERLETLRRAFGIEDYSFASANTESVVSQLDTRMRIYQENGKSLPDKEHDLSHAKTELASDKSAFVVEGEKLAQIEKSMAEAASRLLVLEAESKRIIQLQSLIPLLENSLAELRQDLTIERSELERRRKSLVEIEVAEKKLASYKAQYDEYNLLKGKLRELDGLHLEQRKLSEEIARLSGLSAAREARAKTELASVEKEMIELERKIVLFDKEISNTDTLERNLAGIKDRMEEVSGIQSKAEEISSKKGSTQTLISSMSIQLEQTRKKRSALDGLTKESVCPLCGQKLSPEHLASVAKQFESDIESLGYGIERYRDMLSELENESSQMNAAKSEYQHLQAELIRTEKELARMKEIWLQKDAAKARLGDLAVRMRELNENLQGKTIAEEKLSLSSLNSKRDTLFSQLEKYEASQSRIRELEDLGVVKSYQNAELTASKKSEVLDLIQKEEKRFSEHSDQVASKSIEIQEKKRELEEAEPLIYEQSKLKEQMEVFRGEQPVIKGRVERLSERIAQETLRISELDAEVMKLRKASERANYLKGISSWLSSTFLPAISDIERYVMASTNDEFKDIFQRIFSKLVDESDLRVQVDDGFTPIVEQAGYELDATSLSGGERTTVALAYRLALNYMVKRANDAMRQANVLILDEPTEGFSPEQIYRFRNALEELAPDQVIIVSHERDLEPISDRVYRVEKENGESVLTVIS